MVLLRSICFILPSFTDAASLKSHIIKANHTTGEEETSKPEVKTILMTKETGIGDTMFSLSTDEGCGIMMKTSPLAGAVENFSFDKTSNLHCTLHANGINGRIPFSHAKWEIWKNRSFKWRTSMCKEYVAHFRFAESSIQK